MSERRSDDRNEWYGPDPGQEAGATTATTQAGNAEEPAEIPDDVRDTYGNAGPGIGTATAKDPLLDVPEPPGGPYPPHSMIERPHAIPASTTIPPQPTRDPSLSRAVDRAASGLTPTDAGYDRSNDGPPPGPLDPPVEEEQPDSASRPGGQWGSS